MDPRETPETGSSVSTRLEDVWVCIVWNDPVNLMDYVTHVFQIHFGWPRAKAEKKMLEVHERGRSVVSSGSLERTESDVQAMHSFGLWATMRRSGE